MRELFDPANLVSEFRLHQMRRDIVAMHLRGDVDDFGFHVALVTINGHLGELDQALLHARAALKLRRDAVTLSNAAVTLLRIGDLEEAATLLVEAVELPGGYDVRPLGNLAGVFALMGAWPQARETLAEARAVADLDDVEHLFCLADAAGGVGEYELAVELFARFLARRHGVELPTDALAFIDGCPDDWWVGLRVPEDIEAAVARVRAVREGTPGLDVEAADDAAARSAIDVLEGMLPYRARANKTVLPDG